MRGGLLSRTTIGGLSKKEGRHIIDVEKVDLGISYIEQPLLQFYFAKKTKAVMVRKIKR